MDYDDRPLTQAELDSFHDLEDALGTSSGARFRRERATRQESIDLGKKHYPSMRPEAQAQLPDLRESRQLRRWYPSMFPADRSMQLPEPDPLHADPLQKLYPSMTFPPVRR